MHNPIFAQRVHDVFSYGLELRDRLTRGEQPNLITEQQQLRVRLEAVRQSPAETSRATDSLNGWSQQSLRARNALVYWLDEIFTAQDGPWQRGETWNESKLEQTLNQTTMRATRFWEEAATAEGLCESSSGEQYRAARDVLEVFFLSVVLGFQGARRSNPTEIQDWLAFNQRHFTTSRHTEPPPHLLRPPSKDLPEMVWLDGRERHRQVLTIGGFLVVIVLGLWLLFLLPTLLG